MKKMVALSWAVGMVQIQNVIFVQIDVEANALATVMDGPFIDRFVTFSLADLTKC